MTSTEHATHSEPAPTYACKNMTVSEDSLVPLGGKKRKVDDYECQTSLLVPQQHEEEEGESKSKNPVATGGRVKPTPRTLAIRRELQQCCRNNDLGRAMQVYQQAHEEGTLVEAQSLYNVLNLCDGLGDRPLHVGTPKTTNTSSKADTDDNQHSDDKDLPVKFVDTETRLSFAFRIKQDMDDRNLPLNETAYTALIRILASSKRVDEAAQLLREAEQTQQCKMRLRLYSTLLITYCEMNAMDQVIDLWVRLDREKLTLTEREYSAMIQCRY
jgi:ribonuclease P protein 3